MNIILFSRKNGKSYNLQLTRWFHLAIPAAVMIFVVGLTLGTGYFMGLRGGNQPIISNWKADISQQRWEIQSVKEESQAHINALTQRLGKLQAHVNRLDALGNKLVTMAGLDDGEFNFSQSPGIGGPAASMDKPVAEAHVTQIDEAFYRLEKKLEDRQQQLQVLDHLIMSRNLHKQVYPAGRPVNQGWISSSYGLRTDPFTGKPEHHQGMDFAARLGSDVVAVAAGVVSNASERHGYGYMVEIDHGNGYVTRYAHNKGVEVKPGDAVKRGQVIAKVGSSGRSTGPHVHFEVLQNGKRVNPAKFIETSS